MRKINIAVIGKSNYVDRIKHVIHESNEIIFLGSAPNMKNGLKYFQSAHVVLFDADLITNVADSPLFHTTNERSVPIIVMADGSVNQTARTVHAMSHGAVDFIKMCKNCTGQDNEQFQKVVFEKIVSASNVRIHTNTKNEQIEKVKNMKQVEQSQRRNVANHQRSIIAVGSSTGGPRALQNLLKSIPKGFPAPILIVQHMPSKFTKSLAERLNNVSDIRVKEATQGEVIQNGTAYIAPGNYHMQVEPENDQLTILLTKEETRLGHRPSVNTLLESIVPITNMQKIVVILTGMGRDGAEGVKQIKKSQSDAVIIAESPETTVINGMPNAAIETNCVTEILRIENIGEALVAYTNTRGY